MSHRNKLSSLTLSQRLSSTTRALYPVFDRLIQVFPLTREDNEAEENKDIMEVFSWINASISDSLKNATCLWGAIPVQLMGPQIKEHIKSNPGNNGYEGGVRIFVAAFCQISIAQLGD